MFQLHARHIILWIQQVLSATGNVFEAGIQSDCPRRPVIRVLEGLTNLSIRQGSAKLCFTLGVGYHMIVSLVVSSPACFPNGKVGIMDRDLLHLEPVSSHSWAAYAVAVVTVLAAFQKPEAAGC